MINFNDIFKSSFLENMTSVSVTDMLLTLLLAFGLGMFIFLVYKKTYSGVMYSSSFGGTLVAMTMITSMTILAVTSNVVLSLGMVGALSIVRFRTAVKEPTDTAFLFWALATGIICGAGYVTVSILATLLLGLLFVAIHVLGKKQKFGSYMIVARYTADSPVEDKIMELPGFVMKNKSMTRDTTELVGEVRLKDNNPRQINGLRKIEGVKEISLMVSTSGSTL